MASRQIEFSYLAVIMPEAIAHRKHAGTIEARRPYHECRVLALKTNGPTNQRPRSLGRTSSEA
jgi:hypothetical protein